MAKNRNKGKRSGPVGMEISGETVSDIPQAMDMSESGSIKSAGGAINIKQKKGRPMKRSKNVRRKKAIEKAISMNEKCTEKVLKSEGKTMRIQSAKQLYD